MPLREHALKPLTKSVLIPLELTGVASAAAAAIHRKIFGSDTKIILNEEMNYIMKCLVKCLQESGLLIKSICGRIEK